VIRGLDAVVVERLEESLRRFAERRGLADQHSHGLATPALPEQRRADRIVGPGSRQLRELTPEREPMVPKRLLGGLALGRRAPAPAQRGLTQIAEHGLSLADVALRGARPPRDGQTQIAIDAEAPRIRHPREVLCACVAGLRRDQELWRRLGTAMRHRQQQRQVVTNVGVIGAVSETSPICVDRAIEIPHGIEHRAEVVMRLDEIGLLPENHLELGASR